mmetsp:Transcript_17411/g.45468  ORF Transcript_17411/g.45468 Transcript_17411/m.45468 type:complete len:224 (+) Transcript_17411:417-1088(+)
MKIRAVTGMSSSGRVPMRPSNAARQCFSALPFSNVKRWKMPWCRFRLVRTSPSFISSPTRTLTPRSLQSSRCASATTAVAGKGCTAILPVTKPSKILSRSSIVFSRSAVMVSEVTPAARSAARARAASSDVSTDHSMSSSSSRAGEAAAASATRSSGSALPGAASASSLSSSAAATGASAAGASPRLARRRSSLERPFFELVADPSGGLLMMKVQSLCVCFMK